MIESTVTHPHLRRTIAQHGPNAAGKSPRAGNLTEGNIKGLTRVVGELAKG